MTKSRVSLMICRFLMVLGGAIGIFVGLGDWPILVAACPHSAPGRQACPGSNASLCTGLASEDACDGAFDQETLDNWFGCYAVAEQVQCLDGQAEMGHEVTCYIRCECYWDDTNETCRRSSTICQRFYRVQKLEVPCPPEG